MTMRRSHKPTGRGRIPSPSQGWYRDPVDGTKLRRVTTILEQGVPKGGLIYWAGNVVAECAIENLPWLIKMSRRATDRLDAYRWLTRAHTRKKDERADVGSAVHKLVEAHILGQPVPDELLHDEEMAPFLANFLTFVDDWQVTFTASEMVVANYSDAYAGTLDFMFGSQLIYDALVAAGYTTLGGVELDFMADTKTGGGLDERTADGKNPKGVYPEAGMQMAAYKHGQVCWLKDGSKVDMPVSQPVGIVLHLRPEGYRLYPVRCDDEVYGFFRHAIEISKWYTLTSSVKQDVRGEPLTNPTSTAQKDVA